MRIGFAVDPLCRVERADRDESQSHGVRRANNLEAKCIRRLCVRVWTAVDKKRARESVVGRSCSRRSVHASWVSKHVRAVGLSLCVVCGACVGIYLMSSHMYWPTGSG